MIFSHSHRVSSSRFAKSSTEESLFSFDRSTFEVNCHSGWPGISSRYFFILEPDFFARSRRATISRVIKLPSPVLREKHPSSIVFPSNPPPPRPQILLEKYSILRRKSPRAHCRADGKFRLRLRITFVEPFLVYSLFLIFLSRRWYFINGIEG